MKKITVELDTETNISNVIRATGSEIAKQLKKLEADEHFKMTEGHFVLIKHGVGRGSVSLVLEFQE